MDLVDDALEQGLLEPQPIPSRGPPHRRSTTGSTAFPISSPPAGKCVEIDVEIEPGRFTQSRKAWRLELFILITRIPRRRARGGKRPILIVFSGVLQVSKYPSC